MDKILLVPHVCNNIGGWGAGFVVPLGEFFPLSMSSYLNWHLIGLDLSSGDKFELGCVGFVPVSMNIVVCNMIAQSGVRSKENRHPLDYKYLSDCMAVVSKKINLYLLAGKKVEIHCPKFGCGLAGGSWDKVSSMIEEYWCGSSTVFVYCLD
jgi:hypothetical protein